MSDKNTRSKALEWWVKMKWEDKEYHSMKHYQKQYQSITGEEIERMWIDKSKEM